MLRLLWVPFGLLRYFGPELQKAEISSWSMFADVCFDSYNFQGAFGVGFKAGVFKIYADKSFLEFVPVYGFSRTFLDLVFYPPRC